MSGSLFIASTVAESLVEYLDAQGDVAWLVLPGNKRLVPIFSRQQIKGLAEEFSERNLEFAEDLDQQPKTNVATSERLAQETGVDSKLPGHSSLGPVASAVKIGIQSASELVDDLLLLLVQGWWRHGFISIPSKAGVKLPVL